MWVHFLIVKTRFHPYFAHMNIPPICEGAPELHQDFWSPLYDYMWVFRIFYRTSSTDTRQILMHPKFGMVTACSKLRFMLWSIETTRVQCKFLRFIHPS